MVSKETLILKKKKALKEGNWEEHIPKWDTELSAEEEMCQAE